MSWRSEPTSALRALRFIEWSRPGRELNDYFNEATCPMCYRDQKQGHDPQCDIGLAIAEASPQSSFDQTDLSQPIKVTKPSVIDVTEEVKRAVVAEQSERAGWSGDDYRDTRNTGWPGV